MQKPISVDVMEGEAMLAAARKYDKTVQVGMQRRSTPIFIEAKKNYIESGLIGRIQHVEMCCYYPMRNNTNPPLQPVPDFWIMKCGLVRPLLDHTIIYLTEAGGEHFENIVTA